MSALISFDFDGKAVRAVTIKGEPYFVGKDVCGRLAHTNPAKAMNDHCKGVTKRYPLATAGGVQEVRVLSEPDVLRLIVSSKLPAAERFERWIFETVLPEIRRTGRFGGAGAKSELDSVLALARSCELVRRIHGRPAAQFMWAEMGGMPLPIDEDGVVKRHPTSTKARKGEGVHVADALSSSRSVNPAKAARDDRNSEIVRNFIRECCHLGRAFEVQAKPLHLAYERWAPQRDASPMTATRFGRTMRLVDVAKERRGEVYYLGLRLRPALGASVS